MLLIDLPVGLVVVSILVAVALVLGIGFLAASVVTLRNNTARVRRDAQRRGLYYRRYGAAS